MTPRWTRALPLAAIVLGMLAAQLVWERAHGQVFDDQICVPASWPIHSGLPVCGGSPAHVLTGDKDLDRAVAICDAHPSTATNMVPAWPRFEKDYDAACVPIMIVWEKSNAARQVAERKAKEAADKVWLDNYAKGFKP